jgi:anthranilate phosphoribosyltransferase
MTQTWPGLLGRLVAREDLTADDTSWAMDQIMSGSASGGQIGAFVAALRSKGETPSEVAGMASVMLSHAVRVTLDAPAVDVVGTGGDQSGSVNISTMSAVVTAAAGIPVVKHGNRAQSSRCGAADVLESLGVVIELSPEAVATCVRELGIGFCLATAFHPALRHAGPTRREIGIPTRVSTPAICAGEPVSPTNDGSNRSRYLRITGPVSRAGSVVMNSICTWSRVDLSSFVSAEATSAITVGQTSGQFV